MLIIGHAYISSPKCGPFTALEYVGENVRVRYHSDGRIRLVSKDIPVECLTDGEPVTSVGHSSRRRKPRRLSTDWTRDSFYYRAVGFLVAKVNTVYAEVPPHAVSSFHDRYLDTAGEEVPEDANVAYTDDDRKAKWWMALRIVFKADDNQVRLLGHLSPSIIVSDAFDVDEHAPDRRKICRSALIWELVAMGFRFKCGEQPTEEIAAAIPPDYMEAFKQGLSGKI